MLNGANDHRREPEEIILVYVQENSKGILHLFRTGSPV